jgi:CheY-like chemotaxis protein
MSKKILSIDDSKMVHMVIARTLKPYNIEVITALNGQEGLDKAQQEQPDLIVLDMTMPVMDGYEALLKLKESPLTKSIPVMMLSADGGASSMEKALQAGAVKFINKPFNSDSLLAVLPEFLTLELRAVETV